MTARILGVNHWRAAQARRAQRQRADMRALHIASPRSKRLTLDEIIGPAFDPSDGVA
jgi:catechol-2,3-dioxygenase